MTYTFGSFVLDLERGGLFAADGGEKTLRPKSFAMLCFFLENTGRLLSHDAIMDALWPNVFVTDNSVSQCVREIRAALGDDARDAIRTLSRRGFMFTYDVTCCSTKRDKQFSFEKKNQKTFMSLACLAG